MTQGRTVDGEKRTSLTPLKKVKVKPGAVSKLQYIDWAKLYALRPETSWTDIMADLRRDGLSFTPKTFRAERMRYKETLKKKKEQEEAAYLLKIKYQENDVDDIAEATGIIQEEPARSPEIPRTTTAPWNASDNPWTLDLLRVKGSRPGFKVRWVAKDNLQKYLDQGASLADRKYYGGVTDSVVGESDDGSTAVTRREMILIEFTEEWARQRKEFFKNKTEQRSQSSAKIAQDMAAKVSKQTGVSTAFEMNTSNK